MPHLYLHIPFCRQACHYCDFHFSTSLKNRDELVTAMMKELALRKTELPGTELQTIYFGGGTPSLLSADELQYIFSEITQHFFIAKNAEITLEANPDDLSAAFLQQLRATPVNRLSIGIQSFRDEDLRLMNRAHTSQEAEASVRRAQDAGFHNLTVDLIYGIPGLSDEDWQVNLEKANALGTQHLSAYCLTVEPRTALANFVKTGKVKPVDEAQATRHFQALKEFAAANGFEHYEISNFAKPGFIAKHNSSYWFGEPYLGIGPSAHSFHANVRRWNVSNNTLYVKKINENSTAYEEETLTQKEQFNEFVMTRLRTKWGIPLAEATARFGEPVRRQLEQDAAQWLQSGDMEQKNDTLTLTPKGMLLADHIAAELFLA